MSDTELSSGPSKRGYHHVDEFRRCPRHYYIHHVIGLEPEVKSPALVLGSAMHRSQEIFLNAFITANEAKERARDAALSEFGAYAQAGRAAWFEDDDFDRAVGAGLACVSLWIQKFADADREQFELVGCEYDLSARIEGVDFTGRLDRFYRDRASGLLVYMDTKSSVSKAPEMIRESASLDDQMTMYSWLVRENFGETPQIIIDAAVMKSTKRTGPTPECERTDEIYRTDDEIADFIEGFTFSWYDLCERMEAVGAGRCAWTRAFPRIASYCSAWGCEYAGICRESRGLKARELLPGFILKPALDADFHSIPKEDIAA
jgi:hypothetical protein